MMRHERKAMDQRVAGFDRLVLVHEAGHAVCRVLTAQLLGWRADEVIDRIEIYPVPIAKGSVRAQATYLGKYLSRQMEGYRAANHYPPIGKTLFAAMRKAGIAVDGWYRAQCLTAIFGPMAEAKATGRRFNEVWVDQSSTSDVQDTLRDGLLCGKTPDQISSALQHNALIAEHNIARPEVWRSILALAEKLEPGVVNGSHAARIILQAFASGEFRPVRR
jgi:hypothetical protein